MRVTVVLKGTNFLRLTVAFIIFNLEMEFEDTF